MVLTTTRSSRLALVGEGKHSRKRELISESSYDVLKASRQSLTKERKRASKDFAFTRSWMRSGMLQMDDDMMKPHESSRHPRCTWLVSGMFTNPIIVNILRLNGRWFWTKSQCRIHSDNTILHHVSTVSWLPLPSKVEQFLRYTQNLNFSF